MGMGMSIRNTLIIAVGTFLAVSISRAEENWNLFGFWVGGVAISYALSCWLHPQRNCWRCKGKGSHRGLLWDYAVRACTKCNGRGKFLRLGSKLMGFDYDSPRMLR